MRKIDIFHGYKNMNVSTYNTELKKKRTMNEIEDHVYIYKVRKDSQR